MATKRGNIAMIIKFKIIHVIFFMLLFQPILYGATNKKTIMIDLDGVLNNYTSYTKEIPSIKKGAKDFVKTLSADYELILFTSRNSKQATQWLERNEIDTYFKNVTNVKYPAYIYIDDRSLKFDGDYTKTLEKIENFDIYWK